MNLEPGLLTGFISPIRPKEIVSPSAKSDELFLSWLSDRKTKEFILQLASQADVDSVVQNSSSSSKKHTGTPKKGERVPPQTTPNGSAPLYSLASNRYPIAHIRRASYLADSSITSPPVERKDSNQLLSPRAASKQTKKSPRTKDSLRESAREATAESAAVAEGSEAKSSSGVVPQLSLGKIAVRSSSPLSKSTIEDLDTIFTNYQAQPQAVGLDLLVDDLLIHFGLPRAMFFPLKYRIIQASLPLGTLMQQHLTLKEFTEKIWTSELVTGDNSARIFHLLKEDPRRNYLVPSDWILLLLGLLEEHPGLSLIKGEVEYQERYIDAVVVRLHFAAARRTRTRITMREFRNAGIASSIEQLDYLTDITRYPRYFDYMSYFVIFSNFTALDQDKDWLISREELACYRHHSLTTRIIDRVFHLSRFLPRPPTLPGNSLSNSSAANRRNSHQFDAQAISPRGLSAPNHHSHSRTPSAGIPNAAGSSAGKQSSRDRLKVSPRATKLNQEPFAASGVPYSFAPQSRFSFMDFAWFILAEEDKSSPASMELWFSCLDRDEDGFLSPQDIHAFYEEQMVRMEFTALDIVPFEDALVQIVDMTHPAREDRISLHEIKRSGFAAEIFDMLFNLQKFLVKDRVIALEGSVGMEPIPLASWEAFASATYLSALGEIPNGEENDEWDDENLDIWVEVATEPADSDAMSITSSATNSLSLSTPRDVF